MQTGSKPDPWGLPFLFMLPETAGNGLLDHLIRHFAAATFPFGVKVDTLIAFYPGLAGQKAKEDAYIPHD